MTTLCALAALGVGACGSDSEPSAAAEAPAKTATPLAGRILFQEEGDAGTQLFTIKPDGSDRRQVTRGPGDAMEGDWSPDGRQIAFEYHRPDDHGCAVMLMNADGSGLKDLSGPKAACDQHPAFTPDGERLVFVRYFEKADQERIMSMDRAGRDVRRVGGRLGDIDPNVSPDGTTVTFVRRKRDQELQGLFAVGMDGKGLRQLTPYADEIALKHSWSPDGRRIAVTVNADLVRPEESSNVVSFDPDGSNRRPLTRFEGGYSGRNGILGSYSPDGRHIVLRVEENGMGRLAIMNADGSGMRFVTAASAVPPTAIEWGAAG